jgi:outer membrane protein assembly factor BamB
MWAGLPWVVSDSMVIVPGPEAVTATNPHTEQEMWQHVGGMAPSNLHLWSDSLLYRSEGRAGAEITVISLAHGTQRFSFPDSLGGLGYFPLAGGDLAAVAVNGSVSRIDKNGKLRWKSPARGLPTSASAAGDVLVLGYPTGKDATPTAMAAVSLNSGQVMWVGKAASDLGYSPADVPEVAAKYGLGLLIGFSFMIMYRLDDGVVLGSRPLGDNQHHDYIDASTEMILLREWSSTDFDDSRQTTAIVAWGPPDGRAVWRLPAYGATEVALTSDGKACYVSMGGHIMRLATETGEITWTAALPTAIAYSRSESLTIIGDVAYLYVTPSGAERAPLNQNLFAISLT